MSWLINQLREIARLRVPADELIGIERDYMPKEGLLPEMISKAYSVISQNYPDFDPNLNGYLDGSGLDEDDYEPLFEMILLILGIPLWIVLLTEVKEVLCSC